MEKSILNSVCVKARVHLTQCLHQGAYFEGKVISSSMSEICLVHLVTWLIIRSDNNWNQTWLFYSTLENMELFVLTMTKVVLIRSMDFWSLCPSSMLFFFFFCSHLFPFHFSLFHSLFHLCFCDLKSNQIKSNQIKTKQNKNKMLCVPLELLRCQLSALNIVGTRSLWFTLAIFSS